MSTSGWKQIHRFYVQHEVCPGARNLAEPVADGDLFAIVVSCSGCGTNQRIMVSANPPGYIAERAAEIGVTPDDFVRLLESDDGWHEIEDRMMRSPEVLARYKRYKREREEIRGKEPQH